MPCDYKEYPKNWFTQIRPSILARAGEIRDKDENIAGEAVCEGYGVRNAICLTIYIGTWKRQG